MAAPKPPAGLRQPGRTAWRQAVDVLRELGEDPELTAEPLAAFARAVDDAAHVRAQWRKLGMPATTVGSTGQVVAHPIVGVLERAERWAHELGESLGLDPQARRKLSRRTVPGSRPGTQTAPDRKAPAPPRRKLKAVK